jgi:Bacterial Ig-like domain
VPYNVGDAITFTANVGTNNPLPVGDSTGKPVPIEIAFNRLLMPSTVTRQNIFVYQSGAAQVTITPTIAYDPVARVVTVTPPSPLTQGQSYTLQIVAPKYVTDPSGLHAIDGAILDPSHPSSVTFSVGSSQSQAASLPSMDFCNDIGPLFSLSPSCNNLSGCHNKNDPAEGLVLGIPQNQTLGIQSTAIGRASQEVATGPLSQPEPPSDHFPYGMPIIDPGSNGNGDPGNSYLLYKVLMAVPLPADGGTPLQPYSVQPYDFTDGERQALASLIPGREMPFPVNPHQVTAPPDSSGMTFDQMEKLSLWIAQGAQVPDSCPPAMSGQ